MTAHKSVGAVILAAGASTRLGTPKQIVMLNGETLLDRAVRTAKEAGLSEIVVVLGAFAKQIQSACLLSDCKVIINSDWQEGMGASIRAGVGALGQVASAVLMTCDMPLVSPEHLSALAGSDHITASAYAGSKGVPAYFPQSSFPRLAALSGKGGAKELLTTADTLELRGGELDIDTAQDVERLRSSQSLGAVDQTGSDKQI